MATSWKFKLYVNNTTDRKLTVSSKVLNWGYWDLNDKENSEPIDIEAHTNKQVLGIKAARGTWTGYECSCDWVDSGEEKPNYGTLHLRVDVPFSASNESELKASGLLHVDNWTDLPKSGHNFTRQIELSLVGGNLEVTGDTLEVDETDADDYNYSSYSDQIMNNNDILNDWNKLKEVEQIESFKPLEKLPEEWVYPPKILIGRTQIMDIPKNEWVGLGDPIFETYIQKEQFVDKYFAVGIYTINTDPRTAQSIVAGVETAIEETIEVTSSIKNTLSTHFSIKTSLSAKGTIPRISAELAAALESEFSVTNVTENSYSRVERTTRDIKIGKSDKDRMFVQWMFSEALAIYRVRKNGKVDLIAISEWPIQVINKIYEY